MSNIARSSCSYPVQPPASSCFRFFLSRQTSSCFSNHHGASHFHNSFKLQIQSQRTTRRTRLQSPSRVPNSPSPTPFRIVTENEKTSSKMDRGTYRIEVSIVNRFQFSLLCSCLAFGIVVFEVCFMNYAGGWKVLEIGRVMFAAGFWLVCYAQIEQVVGLILQSFHELQCVGDPTGLIWFNEIYINET
ncbi:uncharacterized protein LOC127135225 isoform X2 [Lathyrus oleraceus]|uniref:uncharacterized protein LOC127135225 isoform X2 n=1 Tax=Pisum sativum TaxID=3888 RepID=UPI0021CEFB37|nr:uncharacterized protein LOC127135225 isoform X2 [Pisum sativum]